MGEHRNPPTATRARIGPLNIQITARGDVDERAPERARHKLAELERFVKRGPIHEGPIH